MTKMAKDELFGDAGRLLAAMDFTAMTAAQEEKQRKEMTDLLLGFLEVVDSLQSLEAHCRELVESGHPQVPLRSVSVTTRKALQVLGKAGVTPMNDTGSKLDLDRHEVAAISTTSPEDADVVVGESLSGYLWNNRLLRRAKVTVSSGEGRCQATTD